MGKSLHMQKLMEHKVGHIFTHTGANTETHTHTHFAVIFHLTASSCLMQMNPNGNKMVQNVKVSKL